MRKKSHISLARYIVNSLDDKELKKHRFSFYIGSVLPDIKPSFFYKTKLDHWDELIPVGGGCRGPAVAVVRGQALWGLP